MRGYLQGAIRAIAQARALAVCLAVVAVSCDGGAPTATALPQLASNSITSSCTSSAFIAKVNDGVILQIPNAFEPAWYRQLCGAVHVFSATTLPAGGAHFYLMFPGFTGYPLDYVRPSERHNVTYDPNDFDPDVVDIHVWWANPDAPGGGGTDAQRDWSFNAKGKQLQDVYGLKCYQIDASGRSECSGAADTDGLTSVVLKYGPPAERIILAQYSSRRDGGLLVSWITHAKHLAQWREIDGQIWKHIDSWNIAASTADEKQ